jgi:hypothetical protein
MVVDKNKSTETIHQQESQIVKVTDEKSNLQTSFDVSLARLDSMATVNTSLNKKLEEKQSDIAKQKAEIQNGLAIAFGCVSWINCRLKVSLLFGGNCNSRGLVPRCQGER